MLLTTDNKTEMSWADLLRILDGEIRMCNGLKAKAMSDRFYRDFAIEAQDIAKGVTRETFDQMLARLYPELAPTVRCEYCFHSREPQSLSREHNLTADTNGKPVLHGLACKVCLADYWRDRAQAAQLEMAKAIQELRESTERLTDAYQKAIEVLTDGRV